MEIVDSSTYVNEVRVLVVCHLKCGHEPKQHHDTLPCCMHMVVCSRFYC